MTVRGQRLKVGIMAMKIMGLAVYSVAWAKVFYLRTKWHLDPSSRLAQQSWAKIGGYSAPFGGGRIGPHLTQCGLGQGLPPY